MTDEQIKKLKDDAIKKWEKSKSKNNEYKFKHLIGWSIKDIRNIIK